MIYVTGDCHADFRRFSAPDFPDQRRMSREDLVIVCGDFGLWHDTPQERWWLDWLSESPFTLAFVDGNHENFDRLYSDEFETVDFCGGKAQMIRKNVIHLLRGQVYTMEGKTFWTFGGASSHDIQDGVYDRAAYRSDEAFHRAIQRARKRGEFFRVNHVSWWEQELPTRQEMDDGMRTLSERNFQVDFIITHCAPQQVAAACGFFEGDILTSYFDEVAAKTKFSRWFFGHYHQERVIFKDFQMLYREIHRIV